MLGIIGAMGVEIQLIKSKMDILETVLISNIEFCRGTICGKPVVVAVCGVGKVHAAIATEAMILRFCPDAIINTGIAGTMTDSLGIGDVAIASDLVQFDMDSSCVGDPPGLISGIDLVYIPTSIKVSNLLEECTKSFGLRTSMGTIATGDHFFKNDPGKKDYIVSTFNAIACEMEGAAIGQVCFVNNTPFGVLRAISDSVDDSNGMSYWEFREHAAKTAAEAMLLFIENYEGD